MPSAYSCSEHVSQTRAYPFKPGLYRRKGEMAMIDDETQAGAANQMEVATEAIREAVLRLLEAGEVDPQYIVLAAARVTGELGAGVARIGDVDLETVLGDL